MSGRYLLNDKFDPAFYETVPTNIIISRSQPSHFSHELTLVDRQFMARLWSWPAPMNQNVIDTYNASLRYFNERIVARGYVDIEHVLYKFLNRDHLLEVDEIGVEGTIAPNGVSIRN